MSAGNSHEATAWRTSQVAGADGVEIAVHELGGENGSATDLPVVLLVHGFPDDHHVWDLVAQDLARDHRVVAHDVRGAGASGEPDLPDGYRMMALIEDIEAVAQSVAPGEKVHLVGHDWGSIQGWETVLHPVARGHFASYLSISAPPLQHVGPWRRAKLAEGPRGWFDMANQLVRSTYIPAFHLPVADRAWKNIGPRWRAQMKSVGAKVDDQWPSANIVDDAVRGMELYRANIGLARKRALPPISLPTDVAVHLLVAMDDPHVTVGLLDGLDAWAIKVTRSELRAGHWVPRSHPEEVAAAIRTHVAANPAEHSLATTA